MNHPRSLGLALLLPLALALSACGDSGGKEGVTRIEYDEPASERIDLERLARPPRPREEVDGLRGFTSRSLLEFTIAPGVPHNVEFTYIHPQRARWLLSIPGEPPTIDYQLGRHRWRKEGHAPSTELSGTRLEDGLRQMEMRLALMAWPADFRVEEAGEEEGRPVREALLEGGLGRIRAALAADGLPARLTMIDPQGKELETYEILSRQTIGGRAWPQRVRLWGEGTEVWREEVLEVETAVAYLDRFFLPVDHELQPEMQPEITGEPMLAPVPAIEFREVPLPEGLGWEEAQERARQQGGGTAAGAPDAQRFSFALTGEGRPRSLLVRESASEEPRQAVIVFLPSLESLGPGVLAGLRAQLPMGARAGTPYVTFVADTAGVQMVQVVLPAE